MSHVLVWPGMNASAQLSMSYLCLEGDISHSGGPRPCPRYNSRAAWWGEQTEGACTAFRNWQVGNRAPSLPRSQGYPLKQRDKAPRHPRNNRNQVDFSRNSKNHRRVWVRNHTSEHIYLDLGQSLSSFRVSFPNAFSSSVPPPILEKALNQVCGPKSGKKQFHPKSTCPNRSHHLIARSLQGGCFLVDGRNIGRSREEFGEQPGIMEAHNLNTVDAASQLRFLSLLRGQWELAGPHQISPWDSEQGKSSSKLSDLQCHQGPRVQPDSRSGLNPEEKHCNSPPAYIPPMPKSYSRWSFYSKFNR